MIQKIALAPSTLTAQEKKVPGAVDISKQFGNFLNEALSKVNNQAADVNQLTGQFATGNLEDVHKLMIANEKAMIGLELTVQVRNKVIEAYQEIMRTQI